MQYIISETVNVVMFCQNNCLTVKQTTENFATISFFLNKKFKKILNNVLRTFYFLNFLIVMLTLFFVHKNFITRITACQVKPMLVW